MGNIENISPQGAEFIFAGKMRRLVFINKAVRYLKEKHGGFMTAIRKIDDQNGEINYDVFADVLFAGFMINKDDKLTIEVITDTLDDLPIFETTKIAQTHLVAAITGVYPEAKKEETDSQK